MGLKWEENIKSYKLKKHYKLLRKAFYLAMSYSISRQAYKLSNKL